MSRDPLKPSARRTFLGQLGMAATALAASGSVGPLAAEVPHAGDGPTRRRRSPWDTSWIDKLAKAQYRVVIDGDTIADGAAQDIALAFLDDYHEVHDTRDDETRPVIVYRRNGTPIAFNDSIWERYAIGEDTKITDSATKAPIRRNPFWKSKPGTPDGAEKLETLQARGLIVLVCNIAMGNWARGMAEKTHRNADEVRAEVKANLIPGALLVPSGKFALIRAQNAGCAYMRGT